MPELVSIKEMPRDAKIALIKKLGYDSDGKFVLKKGKKHLDKYINEPIRINNMFIYPGSTLIIDNNPLSISAFFEEYGDNAI
jgi:hypothetical protein